MTPLIIKNAIEDDESILSNDIIVRRIIAVNPTSPEDIDIEVSKNGVIRLTDNGLRYDGADSGFRYEGDGMSAYSVMHFKDGGLSELSDAVLDYIPFQKRHLPSELLPTYLTVIWNAGEMRVETDYIAQLKWSLDKNEPDTARGQAHLLVGTLTGHKDKESWNEVRFYLKHGMQLVETYNKR